MHRIYVMWKDIQGMHPLLQYLITNFLLKCHLFNYIHIRSLIVVKTSRSLVIDKDVNANIYSLIINKNTRRMIQRLLTIFVTIIFSF